MKTIKDLNCKLTHKQKRFLVTILRANPQGTGALPCIENLDYFVVSFVQTLITKSHPYLNQRGLDVLATLPEELKPGA